MILMYDSITPSAIPLNAEAVAGYVGGHWPDYSELVSRFPKAHHKSIAVNDQEDADILDMENGDAVPSQYPGWHKRQVARGVEVPGGYSDASEMPTVIATARAAGIKDVEWDAFVAEWDGKQDLPTISGKQCIAKQFIDHGPKGENYDISVCDPDFWGVKPTPPVKNTVHYEWFSQGPFLWGTLHLDEQAIVRAYDKYRARQTPTKHPNRAQLYVLRVKLRFLAKRVAHVAITNPRKNGKPSWNMDHRGWRYQNLIHRANGQRFV
jgi:hypothetical protein